MAYEELTWRCDGKEVSVGLDRMGTGPTILLLPALSSISTRREMWPLGDLLSRSFTTCSVDWPGFGELGKPYIDWRPEIFDEFLTYLLTQVVPEPYGIVAAGHATGYVLRHVAQHEHAVDRLVMLSPTWRGPLPTMVGSYRAIFPKIAGAVDRPFVGPILYGMNVNRVVVGMMARGHVYANPDWLEPARMDEKLAVTRTPGARHASARFVTGRLDPFRSRNEQMNAVGNTDVPMLNLFSENAPEKSRLEMEALAELPNVKTVRLPRGKLSFYEEFPEEAAKPISDFLASPDSE